MLVSSCYKLQDIWSFLSNLLSVKFYGVSGMFYGQKAVNFFKGFFFWLGTKQNTDFSNKTHSKHSFLHIHFLSAVPVCFWILSNFKGALFLFGCQNVILCFPKMTSPCPISKYFNCTDHELTTHKNTAPGSCVRWTQPSRAQGTQACGFLKWLPSECVIPVCSDWWICGWSCSTWNRFINIRTPSRAGKCVHPRTPQKNTTLYRTSHSVAGRKRLVAGRASTGREN